MENNLTFEQAMEELEKIVQHLEAGEASLEEALELYKKGMNYSKLCHDKLKNAETQLTKILTDNGEEENFSLPEEEQRK